MVLTKPEKLVQPVNTEKVRTLQAAVNEYKKAQDQIRQCEDRVSVVPEKKQIPSFSSRRKDKTFTTRDDALMCGH